MKMKLSEIRDSGYTEVFNGGEEYPVLFELVPPKVKRHKERFRQHCGHLEMLFDRVDVSGINIPEIHDEDQKGAGGKRRSEYERRVSPRNYVRELRQIFDTRYIINRVTVQSPPAEQEEWLLETYNDYDIRSVVLVGGESDDIKYPGPSVTEGNRLVKEYLNQGKRKFTGEEMEPTRFSVGNICIPIRRRDDFDEPDRMLRKVQTGTDFFTTQIVLDMESPVNLLRDFAEILVREHIPPPTIFWSFTPISAQKDVDFLRWLGVRIPAEVEERILSSGDKVNESVEWAMAIWEKLRNLNRQLPVSIPMGLNISVMGLRNFENGILLAESMNNAEVPQ